MEESNKLIAEFMGFTPCIVRTEKGKYGKRKSRLLS